MYSEKEVSRDAFLNLIRVLDLDEGIRIDNKENKMFVNKSVNRYCIDISKNNKDEFFYFTDSKKVIDFLNERMDPVCKIYSY